MNHIRKVVLLLLTNLILLSGLHAQNMTKIQSFPRAEYYYSNTLKSGDSEATFQIPRYCVSYGILTIDYTVHGRDILVGLEANAFEDSYQSMRVAASNSVFPHRLQLNIRYRGSILSKGLGSPITDTTFRLRRNFSSENYYYHLFEIKNTGQCIIKSQGFGMVTFRMRIKDSKGNIIHWGDDYQQLLEDDLYPGFTIVIPCLLDPLPAGSYTLQFVAQLHNDSVIHSRDPGTVIEGLQLPIHVVNQPNPQPGFLIAEKMDSLTPPLFPKEFYHGEEYLQVFQVHALDKTRIQGQLYLQMPKDSRDIIVKLITDSGITSASWNITVNQDTTLSGMDKKIWRKNNYLNSRKIPILPIFYYPEITARFTLSTESSIFRELEEIKNLGMGPIILKINKTGDPESLPFRYCLIHCRKLNMKIIPSFDINVLLHRENNLNNQNQNDKFEKITKSGDLLPSLQDTVLDSFFQDWKDIIYKGRDGRYVIVLHYPEKSPFDFVREEAKNDLWVNEFRFYLQSKYKTIHSLNTAWNTHYINYSEINPAQFKEWEPSIFEWDIYRSFRYVEQVGRISETIHRNIKSSRVGFLSVPVYGIESTMDKNYYSLYGFNWLGERLGRLALHLLQKKFSRLDTIFYTSIGDTMNIPNIADYAKSREIYPFCFMEYNGMEFLKYLENHPEWEKRGGWWNLPGIRGRDYRKRMALYPRLVVAIKSDTISGISSWNDYFHYSRITEIQKKEIENYQDFISN